MKIWFKDHYRRTKKGSGLPQAKVIGLVERVLIEMGERSAEVGLVLTGDAEIRRLNRRYRGINQPTDVLAFALREDPFFLYPMGLHPHLLGDVVISVPTARRQATEQGHSLEQEIVALMIHGLLHLMGYDHERSQAAARAMKRKERELFKTISGKL
jgi:rRNA maturation RNase YbeY